MYKSIEPWIKIPFVIRPFIKRTGTGGKVFDDNINSLCYITSENKTVTTIDGTEVVSTTQLYVHGDCNIKVTDNVIVDDFDRPIAAITDYYDGNTGKKNIRVVYL